MTANFSHSDNFSEPNFFLTYRKKKRRKKKKKNKMGNLNKSTTTAIFIFSFSIFVNLNEWNAAHDAELSEISYLF